MLRPSRRLSLSAAAPTFATVGVSSAQAVAANPNRKGLVLTNTHATQSISLAFGSNAAVVGSGIVLPAASPFSVFVMGDGSFSTAAVNAIASGASTNMAVQEFT